MINEEKKAVSKAMKEKAEEALTETKNCPNGMLKTKFIVKNMRGDDVGEVMESCVLVRRKKLELEKIIWKV